MDSDQALICRDLVAPRRLGKLPAAGLFSHQPMDAALARNPKLFLLDEPFSALDPLLRGKFRKGLSNLQAHSESPVIMITHDLEDIDVFAETLVVNGFGKVRHNWPHYKGREYNRSVECVLPGLGSCSVP